MKSIISNIYQMLPIQQKGRVFMCCTYLRRYVVRVRADRGTLLYPMRELFIGKQPILTLGLSGKKEGKKDREEKTDPVHVVFMEGFLDEVVDDVHEVQVFLFERSGGHDGRAVGHHLWGGWRLCGHLWRFLRVERRALA